MEDLRLIRFLAFKGLQNIQRWPSVGESVHIAQDTATGATFAFSTAWSQEVVETRLAEHRAKYVGKRQEEERPEPRMVTGRQLYRGPWEGSRWWGRSWRRRALGGFSAVR